MNERLNRSELCKFCKMFACKSLINNILKVSLIIMEFIIYLSKNDEGRKQNEQFEFLWIFTNHILITIMRCVGILFIFVKIH